MVDPVVTSTIWVCARPSGHKIAKKMASSMAVREKATSAQFFTDASSYLKTTTSDPEFPISTLFLRKTICPPPSLIQSRDETKVAAGRGVAIGEFPLKSGYGEADYLPYGVPVGVVEAKKEGATHSASSHAGM